MPINIYDLVKSTTVIGEETIKSKSVDTTADTTVDKADEPKGWWRKSDNGKKKDYVMWHISNRNK